MKSRIVTLLLPAVLCLTACGKMLPVHYYDIRFPDTAVSKADPKYAKTLAIAQFTASSVYRQTRVLYREGSRSAQVGFYDDRRWIAPPTELLTQAALVHFRNSGLFRSVILFTDSSNSDFVLRGRISELEEVDLPDGYYAKVTIEAELAKSGPDGMTLWAGPIRVSRKTTVRDANAIVDELAQGVEEALRSLSSAVDQALGKAVGATNDKD